MKKYLLVLPLLFIPFLTQASFDVNIRYGTKGSDNVKEIQEFLTDQNVYSGPITGNFYALTLKGVKTFQTREGIKADGYWGPATRSRANDLLKIEISEGEENAFLTGENSPLSNSEVAFKFMDGSTLNFNGKQLTPPEFQPVTSIPDFCNNILGSQQILPPGMFRSADNNCWVKPVDNVTVPVSPVATPPVTTTTPTSQPVIKTLECYYYNSKLVCSNTHDSSILIRSVSGSINSPEGISQFYIKDLSENTLFSKSAYKEYVSLTYLLPSPIEIHPNELKEMFKLTSTPGPSGWLTSVDYEINGETKITTIKF